LLIDTAGIRRRGKVGSTIEAYAIVKALAQVDRCHLALTVIDASVGPTEQDARIAGLVHEKGKAQILVVTKWDLALAAAGGNGEVARKKLDEELGRKLGFIGYAPVVTLSSLTGQNVHKLVPLMLDVFEEYEKRVPTGELNRLFEGILEHHPPPSDRGRPIKLYFIQQAQVAPPLFVVSANSPEGVHVTYRRYLANQLRETFGYRGVPIRLVFKKR
jgi:GTP-binding protein